MKRIANFLFKHAKVIKPDVSFVKNDLNKVKNRIIEKDLGNIEIADLLNSALSRRHISFKPGYGSSSNPDYAQLNLIQASLLEDGSIEIEYADEFYTIFEDDYSWNDFVSNVSKLIEHELVHREQMLKIYRNVPNNYKYKNILNQMSKDPDQAEKYLSKRHEIMAFAKEAVSDYKKLGYSTEKIKNLLRNPNHFMKNESHIFWTYAEWFEPQNKVFKQFIKYMYEYLDE